jgi:hypothetical protein
MSKAIKRNMPLLKLFDFEECIKTIIVNEM